MNKSLKWKALIGLCVVYTAVIFNLFWLWGVLLLVWVVQDIKGGVTHLLEPVAKVENPVLFWFIEATWFALALFIILYDFNLITFD